MKGPEPPVAVVAGDKLYEEGHTHQCGHLHFKAHVCNPPVQRMSVCLVLSVQTLDGVR